MSFRPRESFSCSVERTRRAPGRDAATFATVAEEETDADAGCVTGCVSERDDSGCDADGAVRPVCAADCVTDEAAASPSDVPDEPGGADPWSPLSAPQAVTTAIAPTSSAHKRHGRDRRGLGVVVSLRCAMSDLPGSCPLSFCS